MQRIDENTYIDDTLVTCAEYQLFIDELASQRKHYELDHWPSYQFPKGHARKPILGVRFNDAKDFCEWLTQREPGEWRYRLPTSMEVAQHPIQSVPTSSPFSFWALNNLVQPYLAWIGIAPFDARNISLTFDRALKYARARVHVLDHNLDLDGFRSHALSRVIDRTLGRAHDRTSDFDLAIERAIEFAIGLGRGILLNGDDKSALINNFERALDNNFEFALKNAISRSTNRALDLNLVPIFEHQLVHSSILKGTQTVDRALDLFVDLFTLQERIAGRSPAFEGIRLVKERTI